MKIEIWSDVVCPWCYIGKRRFDRALDRLRSDPELDASGRLDSIDIRYRAYQLDPTAPIGSATPVRDVYARKFGGPERAQAIFEQLTSVAAEDDISFHFDIAVRANTLTAHRLLWKTGMTLGYHSQSALKDALLAAYFTQGDDVGDPEVLARCAASVWQTAPEAILTFLAGDEGRGEVTMELAEAASHGITGVPTYLIDGQWAIPGARHRDFRASSASGSRSSIMMSAQWTALAGPLHAELRPGSVENADHPPLIVLHGFTQTSRSWDPFIEFLDPGWAVIRVDLPGHGQSDFADADLGRIADLVSTTCGRGIYIGYSMGGRVALHIALRYPHLVNKLVLIGATPGIIDDAERADRLRADEELASSIERDGVPAFIDRWLSNPMFAGLPENPVDIADRKSNTTYGLANSLRHAGTGTQEPLWNQLRNLQMPVALIVGAEDHKFAAIGKDMAATIGSAASLHLIPGSGHTAHLEQPVAVARVVNRL